MDMEETSYSKQEEEDIKDGIDKYQILFQMARNAIFINDEDGNFIDFNPAACTSLGYTREELLELNFKDIDADPRGFEAFQKVIKGLVKEITFEVDQRKKNGTILPVEITGSIINVDGKRVTLAIARDITRSKQAEKLIQESEARYRSIFEDSPISLWEEDASEVKKYIDGLRKKGIKDFRTHFRNNPDEVTKCIDMIKVLDVNKTTLSLFGAQTKEELMTGLKSVFTERSLNVFKEELVAISEDKTHFETEDITRKLTGEEIHIHIKWSIAPGYEKSYSKRLTSIIEVTQRKRAEEEIKIKTKALEESNRVKDLFTDIMHHDLLNPLNIVSNYAQILKEDENDPKKMDYLDIIDRNLSKGIELIDNATTLSKLESLERIELEDLDIKSVARKVIKNFRPLAISSGIQIDNNLTKSMPIRANKIIEEVFANILSNAIKYAPKDKTIIVEGKDGIDFWIIKIIDFGEGIKDADKTAIFERFLRREKKGVKGSGLGLAITRKIMELHNGRVWVEDNPKRGAVFMIEIPKS
ncbi:MAG: PAS domain-containing sensor histidine kinase [ANME-2 cluster archaeon]|nr:PAS domain-containing sensor histidine kinase [ANME-2 cluster archaeon]